MMGAGDHRCEVEGICFSTFVGRLGERSRDERKERRLKGGRGWSERRASPPTASTPLPRGTAGTVNHPGIFLVFLSILSVFIHPLESLQYIYEKHLTLLHNILFL